jgi:hypothetical protein
MCLRHFRPYGASIFSSEAPEWVNTAHLSFYHSTAPLRVYPTSTKNKRSLGRAATRNQCFVIWSSNFFGLVGPEISTLFAQSFQLVNETPGFSDSVFWQRGERERERERDDPPNTGHSTPKHLTRLLARVHCIALKYYFLRAPKPQKRAFSNPSTLYITFFSVYGLYELSCTW